MRQQTRILFIRHGDRFDFANKRFWRLNAEKANHNVKDPPLSHLGERQARETAEYIEATIIPQWERVDAIFVSPFLRTIQTAQPLSRKLGMPITMYEGISETHYVKDSLPSNHARFAYFPEIDLETNKDDFKVDHEGEREAYPDQYMLRMLKVSRHLESAVAGKNVICFTHAASVSLISALLKTPMPLDLSFKFAPCGIYWLERIAEEPWKMVASGHDNQHILENDPNTFPWGFNECETELWNKLLQEFISQST
mmetsp:Transcript_32361/g.39822  ORF Transcript_32361/g.39822 Transcript_32361/m.39822 type:complete len:254 (-) Transcript_32361:1050-1811(-)|eukprot:CAMPEP_0204830848 /NCGR_PEP_ID=MMETSP1346-20131115/9402_1 /ASSEMBLY_ACC=CAM_ASM_000771 /TAXON_ID=215587 /ORGANISM="Aplanochytrium stocchinoi, Strain GSBS06" /LENGTH=253 /DNA_ID=CAMNT_0051961439 /DNA_START=40 /DNA_END=801 /DNA_ORIENTATION=-